MAVVECPNCRKRLRAPEGSTNASLRCPACRHIFRHDGNGQAEQPASVAAQRLGEASGSEQGSEQVGELTAKMLSQADEALLREYGAGSGLLELTREAYEVSGMTGREERKNAAGALLAGMAAQQQRAEEPPPPAMQGDHQFGVVTTALTLANRLVLTYKDELARARRLLLVAWVSVAVLTLLGIVALWYGTSQSGQLDRERDRTISLEDQQLRLGKDLETARLEGLKAMASRDAVIADQGEANKVVRESQVRLLQVMSELEKYRAASAAIATQPASQPAAR